MRAIFSMYCTKQAWLIRDSLYKALIFFVLAAKFVEIYLPEMLDRGMRSRTELALKIEVTDWSTVAKLFNWSSGVQISCNIFSLLKSCLYSVKCSWIKKGEFASFFFKSFLSLELVVESGMFF